MNKKLILALSILVVLGVSVMSFMYMGNYSEGTRSGRLIKLSKKGFVFSTWEGQLDMGTFRNPAVDLSPIWDFSVEESGNKELLTTLDQGAGKMVRLHYKEKFFKFFWRGDTKYFVTKMEVVTQ